MAAVLFRAGLAEAWISEREFFDATLAIWLPLFFNAEGEESTGWLEQRYLTAPKQQEFAEPIRSVELAAALGCWALSPPGSTLSPLPAARQLAAAEHRHVVSPCTVESNVENVAGIWNRPSPTRAGR